MKHNIRKTLIIHLIILFYTFLLSGFAQSPQTGMCSYYANNLHGKRTASGERYNKKEFTAAHNTLPFHTWVIVTNLSNNKTVKVRINDRGPHTKARVIDLSQAAAHKIGLVQSGITRVKIEICSPDSVIPAKETQFYNDSTISGDSSDIIAEKITLIESPYKTGSFYNHEGNCLNPSGYYIQISTYSNFDIFKMQEEEWTKTQKKEVYCEVTSNKKKSKQLYRLLLGTFNNKAEAEKELSKLNKRGIKGLIKKF